jgi:outer membrane protein OmpA-like peptidoglycan-associated protein
MKAYKIMLFFLLINLHLFGQELSYIRKAESAREKAEFEKAIEYYKKALEIKKPLPEANKGIGVVLGEYMGRYEEAIPYLEKALKEANTDTITTVYYTLGKCYHYIGEYQKAISYYNKLLEYKEVGNPLFSYFLKKHISDCEYALGHAEINKIQSVQNVGNIINTKLPEYVPVLTADNEFIFTSKRKDNPKEKINKWDGKYYESIYLSKLENGYFSQPVLYTQTNSKKEAKILKKHNKSDIALATNTSLFIYKDGDLYESPLHGRKKDIKKLSKNINIARYQNHAALSKDQKTIYFSSESKKLGIGGTDLFMSVKNEKGEWEKPALLDSTVNTISNEDSPFLSDDGTLYFSSTGHPGYGGYDVYKTRFENGHWTKPENLGQPINSPGDDIYFVLTDSVNGYHSSSRKGGYGDMDIYAINLHPANITDSLNDQLAYDQEKKDQIPEPKIQDSTISTLYLPEEELKKLGWDMSMMNFKYNEFALGKDVLRVLEHNAKILRDNPQLTIVIHGYSDSRGPEKYNKSLSATRAESAKQYMINHGIKADRIKKVEGFGESGLLNICSDGIACTEEQHKQNRRVEIKVINSNYKSENPLAGEDK